MARLRVRDFGTSLRFVSATAGGDRVIMTNPTVLDFVSNFTISCWSKQSVPSGTSAAEVYMMAKALPAGGTYKYALFGGLNNKVGFALYNGSSNPRVDSSVQTTTNKWTMWTGVYDGASIKLYQNGTLVGTTATTISLPTGTSNFEVGRRAGASDRNYNGIIDEPRAWNRALSATEISNLYQNGLTRGSALAGGLVGEWLFDEGSGSTAYDTSGNGNHGTITGATYTTDVFMVPRSKVPTTGSIKLRRRQADGEMLVNGAPSYTPSGTVATSINGRWIDGTSAGSTTDDSFGWAFMSEYTGSARMINGMFELTASGTPPSNNHRVDINHVRASDSGGRSNMLQFCIPLEANTTYKATFDLKLENISSTNSRGFRVLASTYNADATASTGYGSTYLNGSRDWAAETFYFSTGTQRGWLRFSMEIRGETGTAYIKKLSLKKAAPNLRPKVNGNLIFNGDLSFVPPGNIMTTTDNRWVDNTAAGTSGVTGTFGFGMNTGANGAGGALFDTENTFNGKPTFKVSTLSSGPNNFIETYPFAGGASLLGGVRQGTATQYCIPVIVGQTYTFSCWAKTQYNSGDSGSGAQVLMRQANVAGSTVSSTYLFQSLKTSTDWTYYETTVTIVAGACMMYPRYEIYGSSGAQTLNMDMWVADIKLKLTPPTTRTLA